VDKVIVTEVKLVREKLWKNGNTPREPAIRATSPWMTEGEKGKTANVAQNPNHL